MIHAFVVLAAISIKISTQFDMMQFASSAVTELAAAMKQYGVVGLIGPTGSGKRTLVSQVFPEAHEIPLEHVVYCGVLYIVCVSCVCARFLPG